MSGTQEDAPTQTRPWAWRRMWWWAAAFALVTVHATLTEHFAPAALVFSDRALAGADMPLHYLQALRVSEAIEGWGETWAWDPGMLAGWPAGTIFDADNKAWALWVHVGHVFGVSRAVAYNVFAWMAHVAVLPVVYGSARLFGLRPGPALLACFGGSMIWWFDSFTHWCWWAGMIAFDIAGYLALLPLALFWRHLQAETARARMAWGAATAVTLGAAHVVHPYTFPTLVVPMLAMYAWRFKSLDRRGHAMVWGIAVVTLAMNLWWLLVAFEWWPYIMDSAFYGQAGVSFLFGDFFGLLLRFETSGLIGTRAAWRLFVLALGVVGVLHWRREGDPRWRPFAWGLGALVVLTYLGSYVTLIAQIQPFRFVVPTAFLALIPGAVAVGSLAASVRRARPSVRTALVVVSIPAAQQLTQDALYFFPDDLPEVEKSFDGTPSPLRAHGYYGTPNFKWQRYATDDVLVAWIQDNTQPGDRIVVDLPHVGDQLAGETHAEIIGGFTLRNLEHSWANFHRRYPQGIAPHAEFARYLKTYGVRWVVASGPAWFNIVPNPNLERAWSGGGYTVFRTVLPTGVPVSKIVEGGTPRTTVHAETNRIVVTGSDPERDLVLRYHWIKQFECTPDCTIGRARIDDVDPIGFVGVPAPHPADLVIENGY